MRISWRAAVTTDGSHECTHVARRWLSWFVPAIPATANPPKPASAKPPTTKADVGIGRRVERAPPSSAGFRCHIAAGIGAGERVVGGGGGAGAGGAATGAGGMSTGAGGVRAGP